MNPKNLVVTMSGGTTTVINATLAGIIEAAQKQENINKVYAGAPGIQGMANNNFLDLTQTSKTDLTTLYNTPASGSIGTTRVKPITVKQIRKIVKVLKKKDIGYFINIGGNGTIQQSMKFSKNAPKSIKIAAIPKTVDNDLGDNRFQKVLYTPGFPSCAQYWQHKTLIFNQENLGAHTHDQVLVCQTFGRETGFIAGTARLADPEHKLPLIILLPEDQQPIKEVIKHIKKVIRKYQRAIIVMSEGYEVGDIGHRFDQSGQVMFGTSRTTAAQLLVNTLNNHSIQARAFVPGFDQRDEILLSSNLDLERSFNLGKFTVENLANGNSAFMSSISQHKTITREINYTSISFDKINNYSRCMPERWIKHGKYDVADQYVQYLHDIIDQSNSSMVFRNKSYLESMYHIN